MSIKREQTPSTVTSQLHSLMSPHVHVSQVVSFAPLSLLTTPQAHLPHSCKLLVSPHSFLLVPALATQTRLPAVACYPRVAPTHVVNAVQHCSHPLPISLPCPPPLPSLRTTASPSLSLSCSCLSAPHCPTFATYPLPLCCRLAPTPMLPSLPRLLPASLPSPPLSSPSPQRPPY